jgi:hypothetical protein
MEVEHLELGRGKNRRWWKKRRRRRKRTSLRSEVMGIGTLIPHLLGVSVWDGGASAPKGANVLCPHHLDILSSSRAASGGTHMM